MKRIIISVVIGTLGSLALWAAAEDGGTAPAAPAPVLQTTCPIMGGKIDKSLYVDYEGQRIYVCCEGCIEPVKKDPAKAIRKLEAEGVTVATVQTTCPIMGGKIDKSLYVDYEGQRLYVCCAGCIGTLKKDPAKYVKALEEKGVALDPTPKAEK